MVKSGFKSKKFNIIVTIVMIFVFINNLIFFNLPMLLMGDGVALGNPSTFSIQFNFPTFDEVDNFKGFAKVAVLAACSILAFKLLVSMTRKTKIEVLNNMKSDEDFEIKEGKAIDLLDCHNPFLYSCKVQALRN